MSRLALLIAGVVGIALVLPTASIDLWGFVEPSREMLRGIVHGQDAVSRRVAELGDQDPRVRRYAAWALGELESDRGVLPLIDKLNDRNADVRLISAWALGEIKSGVAIDPLIELLGDEDPLVREMAALSLGEIEDESAIDALLDGLDRDHGLLEPVIWALGEIGGPGRPVRTALIREAGRPHWGNDQVWIGNLGTREAGHLSNDLAGLLVALQDDDATTRCSAAEWLGRLGDDRAVEPLLDSLRDREPTVRAMTIWALDEINPSRHSDP